MRNILNMKNNIINRIEKNLNLENSIDINFY